MTIIDFATTKGFSKTAIGHINKVRMFLKVIWISDLYTLQGEKLEDTFLHDKLNPSPRESTLRWPLRCNPPRLSWTHWQKNNPQS